MKIAQRIANHRLPHLPNARFIATHPEMALSPVKTIILKEPNVWERGEVAAPTEPGHGEVLVTVGCVGVCGTDFHAFGGNQPLFSYPRVPGHELGVLVAKLGPGCEDSGLSVGDHCAVEPYVGCGDCVACRQGKPNCCTSISVLGVHIDGGLCTQFVCPAVKVHRSEKRLPLDQLAVVEPLCIGAHAVFRASPSPGENVLVIGAGPVGMGVCQFALAEEANVIVMDISDNRLAFVMEQVGVPQKVNVLTDGDKADGEVIVNAVRACFGGELPTCVIDATGAPPSMEKAFPEDPTKEKILPGTPTMEKSMAESPCMESRNGECRAKLAHDGGNHVAGTIQR